MTRHATPCRWIGVFALVSGCLVFLPGCSGSAVSKSSATTAAAEDRTESAENPDQGPADATPDAGSEENGRSQPNEPINSQADPQTPAGAADAQQGSPDRDTPGATANPGGSAGQSGTASSGSETTGAASTGAGATGPAEAPSRPQTTIPVRTDGRATPITFDDLKLDMPVDSKFSEQLLTDRVKALDGQRIQIKGFIFAAGIFRQTDITEFLMVQNTECKFGPGGQAFCIIQVQLDGTSTDFTIKPITVEGVLKVDPLQGPDGNTWAVYSMVGDKVF